jgi:hypothetical protein
MLNLLLFLVCHFVMHMTADFLGSNSGETPATAASASATATAASSPTVKQSPKRLITNLKDFSRLAKSGSHDDKSEACNTTMWRSYIKLSSSSLFSVCPGQAILA